MHPAISLLLTTFLAYLVGAVPFGYLVARLRGVDILRHGSGNIGATNVGRVLGRRYGFLVFLLDFLKGALPVAAARWLVPDLTELPPHSLPVAAGVAAFLGHLFPVYLGFRGGKGVATGAGIVVVLCPLPAVCALATWVAALIVTRYVSVASLLASAVLGAARVVLTPGPWAPEHWIVTTFCFVAAALVWARHHANLRRLAQGTESRLQETGAMLFVARAIHVVAVGLWFGASVFLVIVGATLFPGFQSEALKSGGERPSWFPLAKPYEDLPGPVATFPDPVRKEQGTRAAGFAVTRVFPWYFGIQYVCGVLAAATALAWVVTRRGRLDCMRAAILLVALVCVFAGGLLERVVADRTGQRNALTDAALETRTPEALAAATTARREFDRLHGYSMMLNLTTLVLVAVALVLAAQLPTPAAPEASANGKSEGM